MNFIERLNHSLGKLGRGSTSEFYYNPRAAGLLTRGDDSPQSEYEYARDIIKGRHPEAEPIIMRDPQWAYYYARDIIKGRWPEAEETIMQDPQWARLYTKDIAGY